MEIRFQVPAHGFLLLDGHVVRTDVFFLMGLHLIPTFGFTEDFRANFMASCNRTWKLPPPFAARQAFLSPCAPLSPPPVTYPRYEPVTFVCSQGCRESSRCGSSHSPPSVHPSVENMQGALHRMHFPFYHPSRKKWYVLLHRADPSTPLHMYVCCRI